MEVLALWKVLSDHQLHSLGKSLSAEMLMSLKATLFLDLILSGWPDRAERDSSTVGDHLFLETLSTIFHS
jgi:hypothetical protein